MHRQIWPSGKSFFLTFCALLLSSQLALAQFTQQGPKLVGTGAVGSAYQGRVALSADGNTAIVGGLGDNGHIGAAWVFTRSGGVWTQQGNKLVGTGAVPPVLQGTSIALSADGNTAIIGGPSDDSVMGAAWIFTLGGSVWTQQGNKLVGTGAAGNASQGGSVAVSADGNTAIVGGYQDNGANGAVWVFTRTNGVWTQQGDKLVGTGAVGPDVFQGTSIALSADGNTVIVGGSGDNGDIGAAWVFTGSNGVWTQQGSKLVATDAVGTSRQGSSVWLSADGNTAIVGGAGDNGNDALNNNAVGAAWVFIRSNGVWTQQGSKLVGTGAVGPQVHQGGSVALSADGNTAMVAGASDNSNTGATWVFTRSSGVWTQQGNKLVGTGAVGSAGQGSVALSADGNTAIVGGIFDNSNTGAAWVFFQSAKANKTNTHDFNGDGMSDVLWHDTSGNVAIWEMNGTSILNLATSFVAYVPTAWSIVGTGDFNGDGKSDILWHDTSGNFSIWEMNGTTILNLATSFVANVPTAWSIAGTGDFNGDGMSDILWRDTSGNVAILEMNGTTILNQATSFVGQVPTVWSIVGTGDFNGDGMSDVLWRDISGNVSIWEMNGTSILNLATSFVGQVPTTWSIIGTGDFNGDGMSDILWHDTSGNFSIWEMNGTTILSLATSFVAQVPTAWSIVGSGDFNGDGKSDIAWYNNGNVAILQMNGTTILNQATSFVGQAPTVWSIQHPQGN
jgi:hypothetical protein